MVRKPIGEMDEVVEVDEGDSDDTDPTTPSTPSEFEAFSAADREEANELFEFLQSNGWITYGEYSLNSVPGADGELRKGVTLSVFLPNSLDMDPQEVLEDDE